MSQDKDKYLTNSFGSPVHNDNNSHTLGPSGPVLMQDLVLLEKLAHFGRERIPERVVHAKGAGAFGYFELTKDMSKYTSANFLTGQGKKTELVARFSTVAGERGAPDADRDPRGFAIKFYTQEGNYDLVGNNTPVFFIRDAMKFPDFIHSQKRMTHNNLRCPCVQWDFWSLTPESLHQVVILFSDRGIPASFRHMNGYGSHTFMWYNAEGQHFWVKYHFKTDQGIECLYREDALRVAGEDPDHATRDLYKSLEEGNYPSWTVQVQILHPDDVDKIPYNIFDVTKVWPHKYAKPIDMGKMVLNKAPENYFQDIEQAAFNPSSFVPGIGPSPDKMLQGRLFSYHDTHLHRLGANYHLLPVNRAKNAPVNNYYRDGFMSNIENATGPNYWPNSFGGPAPADEKRFAKMPALDFSGLADQHPMPVVEVDYEQPNALYSQVMTDEERERFIGNVVASMAEVPERIQLRSLVMFYNMNESCADKMARALNLDLSKVEKLATLSYEDLVKATAEKA